MGNKFGDMVAYINTLDVENHAQAAKKLREQRRKLVARISLRDWTFRLNLMMVAVLGRTTSSFCEDWKWEQLYHAGCTPGEVVEGIVEEFRSFGVYRAEGRHDA